MGTGAKFAAIGGAALILGMGAVWIAGAETSANLGSDADPNEVAVADVDRDASAPQSANEPAGNTTLLENAILEAFDGNEGRTPAETENWHNSVDYVRAAINAEGFLCAVPYEMQEASDGVYGIGCIMNRDRTGKANYLVNTRTGEVTRI